MKLWKLWTIPAVLAATGAGAETQCSAARATPLLPADPALCAELEATIREPSALALHEYETKLDAFFGRYCHRNAAAGWVRDKRVRSTGPFTAALDNGRWTGAYHGTHSSVVIWYSREMAEWLRANRSDEASGSSVPDGPVPDGAVMVKEMFVQPADDCAGVDPARLLARRS